MMNEKINNYVRFFRDQKREVERTYSYILDSSVSMLLRDGVLNLGTIVAVSNKSGHITIKIKKGYAPRLKMLKSFSIVTLKAKSVFGQSPLMWDIKFRIFHEEPGMRMGESDIMPLYFKKSTDTEYDYIVCGSVDMDMFSFVSDCVNNKGKQLTTLLYDSYPPTEYFDNLAYFTHTHREDEELLISPKVSYDEWHPEELAYSDEDPTIISDTVTATLEKDGCCILQGPPGTGKSYTIASIISHYISLNKSVCVATMANTGLIELAKQKPLATDLSEGRIYKTSLKSDEGKLAPGIKPAKKDLAVPKGSLLCTTFYKLSTIVGVNAESRSPEGMFDLIVIEEASQAFLSTIVAFKSLGNKCLIVGDPMQLPPIVQGIGKKPEYDLWDATTQTNGMSAYALGTNIKSYRIVTTFRLTPKSAELTKMFYSSNFRSVKKEYIDFNGLNSKYFPREGGVLYKFISGYTDQNFNERSLRFISDIIHSLEAYRPESTLAIISPFRETVKKLQSEFQTDKRKLKEFTVETIDRIQGMTVDYAILYLPAGGSDFALDERRFNVATSRSLSSTLIISDVRLEKLMKFKGKVKNFILASEHIE